MGKFHQGLAEALSLYVRALAWWYAVPQPPPSKLKDAPKIPQRRSRWQMRVEAGGEPELPDVDPEVSYLVTYLFDAGPTSPGGQSGAVLSWSDIKAWQEASGVSLAPWQARLLRRLSGEYLAESMRADAHDAPPPFSREPDRVRMAKHVRNILRS